jgi:secondary thiamine-phosphate synthase enzyme
MDRRAPMHEILIRTSRHTEFLDITDKVQEAVTRSQVKDGICTIFIPHTTAGITINENADPDVVTDMIHALDKVVPWKSPAYRHAEGNTAAHVKSSMMGHSALVMVSNRRLMFGTWQGIYFCEFDGPRSRKAWVTVQSAD